MPLVVLVVIALPPLRFASGCPRCRMLDRDARGGVGVIRAYRGVDRLCTFVHNGGVGVVRR